MDDRSTEAPIPRNATCSDCGHRVRRDHPPATCPACGGGPVVQFSSPHQQRLRQRRDARRWPLEPLLDVLRMSKTELARHVPFNRERAAKEGLSDSHADRITTHYGLHPIMVWGWDWVIAGLENADCAEDAFESLRLHRDSAA